MVNYLVSLSAAISVNVPTFGAGNGGIISRVVCSATC